VNKLIHIKKAGTFRAIKQLNLVLECLVLLTVVKTKPSFGHKQEVDHVLAQKNTAAEVQEEYLENVVETSLNSQIANLTATIP